MKIENQKLSVKEAFINNVYYIPDYQREYVWDGKNVGQLLEDIYEEYSSNPTSEYFIGSTVVTPYNNKKEHYEVIDGQQRLTTLYVFLCAFRAILKSDPQTVSSLQSSIMSEDLEGGDYVTNYKLNLQYSDSTEIIRQIIDGSVNETTIRDSAKRIYEAFKKAAEFINVNFDTDDIREVRKFLSYFINNVNFIQIETPNIGDALKTFETINERGVGLNPMDLLKNLLFRQIPREQFKQLNADWKNIIDILDKAKEKKLRFLRYFILSSYEVEEKNGKPALREEDIYLWLVKNEKQCNYSTKPFEFVKDICKAAEAYISFANGKDNNDRKNIHLENIKNLGGGSFSQHLILLLPTREMEPENFDRLAKNIETLIMYYTITRTPAKDLERKFATWTKQIKKIAKQESSKESESLDLFINNVFAKEIKELEADFKLNFMNISFDKMQTYKLRYLLGKIAQYIDSQRVGNDISGSLDQYLAPKIEIEHILPNSPTTELIEAIGGEEEYNVYKLKLGNLTLLEKPHNVVAGREFFEKKLPLYAQSHYYLTRSLAKLDYVGANTSVTRINKKLNSYEKWGKESIDNRQSILYDLAKDIWKVV